MKSFLLCIFALLAAVSAMPDIQNDNALNDIAVGSVEEAEFEEIASTESQTENPLEDSNKEIEEYILIWEAFAQYYIDIIDEYGIPIKALLKALHEILGISPYNPDVARNARKPEKELVIVEERKKVFKKIKELFKNGQKRLKDIVSDVRNMIGWSSRTIWITLKNLWVHENGCILLRNKNVLYAERSGLQFPKVFEYLELRVKVFMHW